MDHRLPQLPEGLVIREFDHRTDSLEEMTLLLHKSYKLLADMGFRFVASYQDAAKTFERIQHACCLVAMLDSKMIGTISYYAPGRKGGTPWYDRTDVAKFGQFAVEPKYQQAGVGGLLLTHVEKLAAEQMAKELALDTAEGAAHLIRFYTKRGYRFIEYAQWKSTNYRSVILSKPLQ